MDYKLKGSIKTNNSIKLSGNIKATTLIASTQWGRIIGNIQDQTDLQQQFTQEATNRTTGDANTLSAAKTYTNNYHDLTKVDKEQGKGLSSNDYTSQEKAKLSGIAEGAEVNVQSDWNQTDATKDDFIKNKPTIPSLDDYYTKEETDTKINNHHDSTKQNTLVSGTNIKTINEQSILGEGNIDVGVSKEYVDTQDASTLTSAKTYTDNYHDSTKQDTISSTNKLSSDLVDDTNKTNLFVTQSEKAGWDSKVGSLSDLGITATSTELNYSGGVTSNIQTQLNNKQDTLPTVINDRYLHTNSNTGELEWTKVSASVAWGNITGTLNDQTDLKNVLNSKQPNLPLGNANTYLHRNSSNNLEWTKINAPQIIVSATQPQDQVTGDWWYYAPEPTVIELDYFKLDNMSSLEVITDY